jgi:pimeloyl-ACP methyl ester carboxylesterase
MHVQAGAGAQRNFWRWHGQLVDYLVAEPEGGVTPDTQAILLVHGFGAFAEHWRRNIPDLAAQGFQCVISPPTLLLLLQSAHCIVATAVTAAAVTAAVGNVHALRLQLVLCRVYACTLPGFGPSEKSPQNYTTALWKAYVRDFAVHVVGKPVVVAGNSIGGVVPANACADHPDVFRGIVLINTAGSTDTSFDPDNLPPAKERNKLFVDLTGWLVFNYLQGGIGKQLERLYPVRPTNADAFLNDEIYRASCDPCALQACSDAHLSPSCTLNICAPEIASSLS